MKSSPHIGAILLGAFLSFSPQHLRADQDEHPQDHKDGPAPKEERERPPRDRREEGRQEVGREGRPPGEGERGRPPGGREEIMRRIEQIHERLRAELKVGNERAVNRLNERIDSLKRRAMEMGMAGPGRPGGPEPRGERGDFGPRGPRGPRPEGREDRMPGGGDPGRPGAGPQGPESREGHVREAIHHLHAAGLHEAAHRLEERFGGPGPDIRPPAGGPPQGDAQAVRDLQSQMREMKLEMRRLREALESAKPR